MKKIIALVLALAMVLTIGAAFADGTHNLAVDNAIGVTGLDEGDSVTFYRVLKFDQDAKSTGGWINDTGFTLSDTEIQKILGLDANGKPADDVTTNPTKYGIDAVLAAKIADMTKGDSTVTYTKYPNVTAGNTKAAVKNNPDPGLYVAIITPAKAGIMYNPIFVAADYANLNTSNSQEAVTSLSYSPEAMAKKTVTTVDKKAEDATTIDGPSENYDNKSETVSAGDVVKFTVDTKIPEFGNNYTEAAFTVTDTLSDGLELQNAAKTGAASNTDYSILVGVGTETVTAGTNTFSVTASATGYTIDFVTKFLLDLDETTDLHIEYYAKVTTSAPYSVNKEDNTVVVSYSNNPNDTSSRTKLIDKTNHYTFDIDANLLGKTGEPWVTTEAVKVGIDANGNEIHEVTTILHPGQEQVGALQGAEFALYTDSNLQNPYTNSILTSGKKIISDATGRLTIEGETTPGIRGLDAGTYYLVETKAPDGYIKWQSAIPIVITPVFEDFEETIIDGTDTLKVTTKVLKSYTVTIDGNQTASYTITNSSTSVASASDEGDKVTGKYYITVESDENYQPTAGFGKIKNIKGVELPSTGGIGTTIFYIVGGLLLVGAAVILVARKKSND